MLRRIRIYARGFLLVALITLVAIKEGYAKPSNQAPAFVLTLKIIPAWRNRLPARILTIRADGVFCEICERRSPMMGRISVQSLRRLLQTLEDNDLTELDSTYIQKGALDAPTINLILELPLGTKKEIAIYGEGPDEIKAISKAMWDAVANSPRAENAPDIKQFCSNLDVNFEHYRSPFKSPP